MYVRLYGFRLRFSIFAGGKVGFREPGERNSVRSLHKGWENGLDGIVNRTRNGLRAARRRDRGRLSSGRRTGRGEGWGEESLLQGYGTMHLYTSSRYSKALGKDEGKHRRRIESSHAMRPPV